MTRSLSRSLTLRFRKESRSRLASLAIATSLILGAMVPAAPEAHAFPARFGVSPDNSLGVTVSAIRSARRRLLINIYQFDSAPIADAVVERMRAGVEVQILLEGQPLGRISSEGERTLERLRDELKGASPSSRIWIMSRLDPRTPRRFRYNHAKYAVIDGRSVLITSENFTSSGHPSLRRIGNRGWVTLLQDADLARRLTREFERDIDTSFGDVVRLRAGGTLPAPVESGDSHDPDDAGIDEGEPFLSLWSDIPFGPQWALDFLSKSADHRRAPTFTAQRGDVRRAELITSPHSLPALLELIRSARSSIDVEEMSLPSLWRERGVKPYLSPLLNELVLASQRGVQVRVLVNDDNVFRRGPVRNASLGPNKRTALWLGRVSSCLNLPLEARVVNTKKLEITYVHNKGFVIDGERVLVSSINGTRNSIENNREVAVALESPEAARYFGEVFEVDWKGSPKMKRESNPACDRLTPAFTGSPSG